MALRTRHLRPVDAPELAAWVIREQPVPKVLATELPNLLATGLANGSLKAVGTDVQAGPNAPWTLDAFGVVGFMTPLAVGRYANNPPPFMALTMFEHVRQDGPAPWLLDLDGIAAGNAGDGLHMFICFWFQSTHGYASAHSHALLETAYRMAATALRGYRLQSVSLQGRTENEAAFRAGGFINVRIVPLTPEQISAGYKGTARIHAELRREEAEALLPGSPVRNLFLYEAPTLRFTPDQQAVIDLALADLPDEAIADHLGIQLSAVQKRWQRVYEKIETFNPALFGGLPLAETAVRGPEKRRSVVAYVRMHPQELRPYAWDQ